MSAAGIAGQGVQHPRRDQAQSAGQPATIRTRVLPTIVFVNASSLCPQTPAAVYHMFGSDILANTCIHKYVTSRHI